MATMNTISHPYAKAIFEIAESSNTFDRWLADLKQLSLVVQDANFKKLINNPRVSGKELLDLLLGVLNDPKEDTKNFLAMLCENHRLQILPEICMLFEQLVNRAENKASALIQSAFAMNGEDKTRLEGILSKKMGKKITATVEIHPELIGGIKVIINDSVIDSSVRGSLDKMATKLIQ